MNNDKVEEEIKNCLLELVKVDEGVINITAIN